MARAAAAQGSAPVAASSAAPSPSPPVTGLTRSADTGEMTWRGVPVRMTSTGVPAVATRDGWMSTTAAAGLSDDELRDPYQVAAMSPNGATARLIAEGPA
jgi:hypothetical protein